MSAGEHTSEIPWRYVLSAGRTGTVFLERMFAAHAPGVTAIHEPSPSRYLMMLANMRNDLGVARGLTRTLFRRTRARREAAIDGPYVEINPFLCPMTDLLPDPARPLRLLHLVRDPVSWAESIVAFKASSKFRWLIDVVPFAKPYPAPRPEGWRRLDTFAKALWRWRWTNQRICDLEPEAEAYAVVRYEDLFSQDLPVREHAVRQIFETLQIPLPEAIDWNAFSDRVNPAPGRKVAIDRAAAGQVCGELARRFGYAY